MADHDSGYKLLFSHRRMVKELLQGFIREEWVSSLDFSSLQKVGSLVAENQLRPEELALPGNRVSKVFSLETCDPRDLPRLTAELAALLPPGREERLRHAVTQWLLRLLRRLLPGVTIPETAKLEDMAMLEETILEWWKDAREEGRSEGLLEGRQEGRKEGEVRGQVKGMRQMLFRVLEERFGRLPQKTRRRVEALASARELESLVGRALTAKSLEELGLG